MSQNNKRLLGFSITALFLMLLSVSSIIFNTSTHAADNVESFDHFTTGFPLTGKHQFLDCSSCHIGGIFKGTPLECALCHNRSRAPGKHPGHVASSNICDDCHTTDTWIGARFDHSGIFAPCESCHNNSIAVGLSPSHIATTSTCEDCHNTITFGRVGRVDHGSVLGTCNSCHNGVQASGMSPRHIATNAQCDTCHNTNTWRGARFDHSNVTGACSSCHNGVAATGKHPAHLQTTVECDNCHNTNTWLGAGFDHVSVTGPCSSCHNGVTATGKHPAHLPTIAECNNCHTTITWLGARFDHSTVTGLCLSCHNGSTATGKSTTHFVTTLDCDRCHSTASWIPLILFRHDSPDYPGDHRTGVLCVDCHRTNNQVIAWTFPAYQPDCAGCHAGDYKPDSHKGPGDVPLSVSELRDCSGSCHLKDGIKMNEHRPSASGW